jgi:hypothetical protein
LKIVRFEDIEAWQLARELTRKVYSLTKKTSFSRDYGLMKQIQDVYNHAGRTRAAIRGFVKYLLSYKQSQPK